MLKTLGAVGAILLGLAGSAQARLTPGRALLRASSVAAEPAASCPAGMPTQTITVIDQAGVRPFALAKVENAVVAQSLQLRAAWGTPCVVFGGGGWPLYLQVRPAETAHFVNPGTGTPWAVIATSGLSYQAWSSSLSHETIEMLADPSTQTSYTHNGQGANLEPADPVEHRAYRLGGVWVSDFVTPAWYAGATFGISATQAGETWYLPEPPVGSTDAPASVPLPGTGAPVTPAGDLGPYDEMGTLTGPWQAGAGAS